MGYWIAILWLAIDIMLVVLWFRLDREEISKNKHKLWKRSLVQEKKPSEKIMEIIDLLPMLFFLLTLYVLIHGIFSMVSYKIIISICQWYKNVFLNGFIASIVTFLLGWIKDNKLNNKLNLFTVFLLIAFWVVSISLSFLLYYINLDEYSDLINNQNKLNIRIAALITILIGAIFEIVILIFSRNKKIPNKGIYKDLSQRTSRLKIDFLEIELVRACEIYFNNYCNIYQKIEGIYSIEYVNLLGRHEENWYKRVANVMKKIILISFVSALIELIMHPRIGVWLVIDLLFFVFMIQIYKKYGHKCLCKIAISLMYCEWGYYIRSSKKTKFVGDAQLWDKTKYHKYVHSYLDIVALCRAVLFNDQIYGKERIKLIVLNLKELFLEYTDFKDSPNWILILPLWVSAMFAFSYTKEIDEEVKAALISSVNESNKVDISIFLQSFWADVKRKKISEKGEVSEFVRAFETELFA